MTNRFFAGQTNYIEEMNALDGETGDHIADATGAHAATAISNTPAGNIAATTVQAAINELDTEKLSASATTLPASFTASSLTSVGTLGSLAVSGTARVGATPTTNPLAKLFVQADVDNAANFGAQCNTNSVGGSSIVLRKSRGTNAAEAVVQSGDLLGALAAFGFDGAAYIRAAEIRMDVDGTPGTNDMPGRIVFGTTADGASGVTERLRIDSAGLSAFTGNVSVSGQAIFAAGSAAAPGVKVGAEQNGLYSSAANTLDIALGGIRGFQFGYNASGVNYFRAANAVSGAGPLLLAAGSDTNVPIRYRTQAAGSHIFETGSSGNIGLLIAHVASAVNYGQFAGNSAGGYPSLRSAGSDTNVGFDFATQGAAPFRFYTNAFGAEQFRVAHTANAVNYAQITGSATGLSVVYGAAGIDANVSTVVTCKGASSVGLYSNSGLNAILFASHVASSVNYWNITGAATGGLNTLTTQGSDANIGAYLATKGTGTWRFATGGGDQVRITDTASAVNRLELTGSATGNAVTISAQGSDTNIDFALTTKGTGVLRFGTHSALAAETVTGYITIKDSAGNTRKLAVLS